MSSAPFAWCSLALLRLLACAPDVAAPRVVTTTSATRMDVTQADGISSERVRELLAPATGRLRRCVPEGGRALALRVTSEDGVLRVAPASGSASDATSACVAAALSSVHLEPTGSNSGGPAVPPTGFTSLITVEW